MPSFVSARTLVCAFVVLASSIVVARAGASTEEGPVRTRRSLEEGAAAQDARVRGRHESGPQTLADGSLAFAPTAGRRTVVYLHGMHGKAANGCPFFRAGASEIGWLVCPTGIEHGAAGTASWGADVPAQARAVDAALTAAVREGASPEPGVAVGFSQGGYVALDLVRTGGGRFRGLVLLAAPEAHPKAAKLHEAGVRRVVLGAGRRDAAYPVLRADAARLASEGMEVRFLDLGDVGHTYDGEDPDALRDAVAWAGEG